MIMRKWFFYLTFTLFITGCAATHSTSSVLYEEFVQYKSGANKNNIIEVADHFFSSSLLGKNYRENPDAVSQLLFKNYMVNTYSHHEKKNGQGGCLTINGYDEEGSPLIFSLGYVYSGNRWLIDKIHVVFVEDEKGFTNSAKCPDEYPD